MGKNRVPVEAIREAMIYFIKERNISVPVVLKTVDISRSRLYDATVRCQRQLWLICW